MRQVLWLSALVGLSWLAAGPNGRAATAQVPPSYLIVVIHSYDTSSDWTHDISEGVFGGLREAGLDVDVREEYLDARRDTRPEYQARVRDALAAKYALHRPDLVVTSDDPALEFLLAYPDLLAQVPVVFGGVESRDLLARAPRARFTGVVEEFRLDFILDTALRLRPSARRVYVVTANTRGGEVIAAEAVRQRERHPEITHVGLPASRLGLEAIVARLRAETTSDDIVLTTPVVRDVAGVPLDADDSVRMIVEAARGPVFGIGFSETDQGVLAATASTGVNHGWWMARKVVALLRGRAPADEPIEVDSETQLVFEAAQLDRWGIADAAVPGGSEVRNRPASFFARHRGVILTSLAFIALQMVVIGGLVINVVRRRHAEVRLSRQAVELSAANTRLAEANHSLQREYDARRETEEHLRHAQKMDAVGRLAGGIAHDFNNLLTIIIGYCALLLDERHAAIDRRESLEQIRRASEQAATLTQNLLAFSRRQIAAPVVVDIVAAITAMRPMIARFCGENIQLALHLDPATGLVELGEGQLEQIVINLVINARDAMPSGGRVVVSARSVVVGDPPPGAPDLESGAYAVIEVVDTGVGMDADTRARVFEPFFTTKGTGRGTGLGLATVYGIVTQHRGAVSVSSTPGQGAHFTIWLPLSERQRLGAPALAAPGTATAAHTILLVEDEDELRRLASLVLRGAGFEVIEAAGGRDALRLAATHQGTIDLVLTDIVMPGQDGYTVARFVRDLRPAVRVGYMSGYADQALVPHRDGDEASMLRKPFTPDDLVAHVHRLFQPRPPAGGSDAEAP